MYLKFQKKSWNSTGFGMLRHRLEGEHALSAGSPSVLLSLAWAAAEQAAQLGRGWGSGSASLPCWCEGDVVSCISMSLCTSGTRRRCCQLCGMVCVRRGRGRDCSLSWCAGSCLSALGQLVLTGAARSCMWILNIQTSYYKRRPLSILFPPALAFYTTVLYGGGSLYP